MNDDTVSYNSLWVVSLEERIKREHCQIQSK